MRDHTICQLRKTGNCDGRLVRNTERVLRSPEGQGQDEADGNPVHLLRHPHGKRGAAGGQDITKGAFGSCLTLKLAVNAELLWENCILGQYAPLGLYMRSIKTGQTMHLALSCRYLNNRSFLKNKPA